MAGSYAWQLQFGFQICGQGWDLILAAIIELYHDFNDLIQYDVTYGMQQWKLLKFIAM